MLKPLGNGKKQDFASKAQLYLFITFAFSSFFRILLRQAFEFLEQ
jgi:hypothetical protein